jgi:RPA family protein
MNAMVARRKFTVLMIKPSHYDDEGYVIQSLRPEQGEAILDRLIYLRRVEQLRLKLVL